MTSKSGKSRRERFAAGLVKDGERAARKYLRRAADDQEAAELVGKTIVFEYPRHNFEHVPLDYRTRIFRVDEAREFGSDPNDEPAAERNPHLRRRGKLLVGVDLACGELRKFYRGAMRNVHPASPNEVAALTPPPAPVVIVERPIDWEPRDVNDVPPGVAVRQLRTPQLASIYAQRFNQLELMEAVGRWAVR
jgi:hypothetical protein